jgi:translation elongation factor EF-4
MLIECTALRKEVAVVARGGDIDPMNKLLTKQSKEGMAEKEVPVEVPLLDLIRIAPLLD